MKLHKILEDQTIAATQFDFTGTCPDKEGTNYTATIFNTAFFVSEILHNYFNREMFIMDPEHAYNEFCSIFNLWEASRGLMFARMAYAYSLGYNPIENYSSIEIMDKTDTLEHGLNIAHILGISQVTTYNHDKVTNTYTQDKVETTYTDLKDTTKRKRYGVNSANAVNTDEDENTRSGSQADTHTGSNNSDHTGSVTNASSGTNTDKHTGKDTTNTDYTLTKSGNIGVMTASQMLQSQFDGLNQDLADRAIKDFLQHYTFYSGEVDFNDY